IIDHYAIRDPGFPKQWHLYNTATPGADINVLPAWAAGTTGRNITVALVDDGLDYTAQDLASKFEPQGSFDFNDHEDLPTPKLSDDYHGTRCAGEVAASINTACGVGVALDARVSGIRILSGQLTSGDEARAYMYKDQLNDIYSCSFGPSDDGTAVEGPSALVKRAFAYGFTKGRRDLGSVYVFASGNGGMHKDDCNADGYANSNYTITIGAVSKDHESPWYAENCAAQLACTYSGGAMGQKAIFTTDVGASECTDTHSGTSAAAPIGAGIFALALSARPDLSVRTLQYLVVDAAVPFNLNTSDPAAVWATLPTGRMFSHRFGFGKLDAARLVAAARAVKRNVLPHVLVETPWSVVDKKIFTEHPPSPFHASPGLGAVNSTIDITPAMLARVNGNASRTETVMVTAHIDHDQRGDIEVDLISPLGVVSKLMTRRPYDTSKAGFQNWTFSSVQHWGEPLVGTWTLRVSDWTNPDQAGVFKGWSMQVAVEVNEPEAPAPRPPPPSTTTTTPPVVVVTPTSTQVQPAPTPTTTLNVSATRNPLQSPTSTPPSDHTAGGGGGAFASSTAIGLVGGLAAVGAIAGGLIKAARTGRLSLAGARQFIASRFGGNAGNVGYEFQTLGGDEREVLFEGFLDDDDDDVDVDSRSSSGFGGKKAATAVSVDTDEDEEVMGGTRVSMGTSRSSSRGGSPMGRV
ncbi:peptidase S8/S53 domain-containing protein, partial [Catenaria anguillulae PL171]